MFTAKIIFPIYELRFKKIVLNKAVAALCFVKYYVAYFEYFNWSTPLMLNIKNNLKF